MLFNAPTYDRDWDEHPRLKTYDKDVVRPMIKGAYAKAHGLDANIINRFSVEAG
jgi:hypothetical protein